jgi:hypothetical protein
LALILACTLKSPWFALSHLLMTVGGRLSGPWQGQG